VRIEFQKERTELLADPETVRHRLDRFHVEIRARQIALFRAFHDDGKRSLLVRIAEEHGFDALDRSLVPVELDIVQHQHGIRRIELGAETIVGQRPEAAVFHGLDTGKALHWLAVERNRKAGLAHAVLAFHRADAISAFAVGGGELARGLQVLSRILRRSDDRVRGQDGMGLERGRKSLFFSGGRKCQGDSTGKHGRGDETRYHDKSPLDWKYRDAIRLALYRWLDASMKL